MLQMEYLQRVRELIDDLESKAAAQTEAAAETIVEALVASNQFYISPLGHGNDGDLLHRAGGLVAARRFSFNLDIRDGGASDRPREKPYDTGLEAARVAVRGSRMRAGDCIILGSVSGRSSGPVSLAIAAGEIGATTIGITSLEYSAQIAASHSSGQKLDEVCDIVIDNCVPYGDAALAVPGLAEKAVPLSGLATTMTCWMICSQVIEKLLVRGLEPSYYISANRPDGPQFNEQMEEQCKRQGY